LIRETAFRKPTRQQNRTINARNISFVITIALTKVTALLFAFRGGYVPFDHDLYENNQSAQAAHAAGMHPRSRYGVKHESGLE